MWDLRFIILNSLKDIDSNKYGGNRNNKHRNQPKITEYINII